MKVELKYAGKRVNNAGKTRHVYYQGTERLVFIKRLGSFDVIGDILTCERDSDTFKPPYEKTGKVPQATITTWSIEQQSDLLLLEKLRRAKLKPSGHVDALIKAVIENTGSAAERKRIALYIFDKISP